MLSLDSILVITAVVAAVGFVIWRIRKLRQGKAPCCGKGCGCVAPKLKSKITAKKA